MREWAQNILIHWRNQNFIIAYGYVKPKLPCTLEQIILSPIIRVPLCVVEKVQIFFNSTDLAHIIVGLLLVPALSYFLVLFLYVNSFPLIETVSTINILIQQLDDLIIHQ